MADDTSEPTPKQFPVVSWQDFLETTPPGTMCQVDGLLQKELQVGPPSRVLWKVPPSDLQLHCDSEQCGGVRMFFTSRDVYAESGSVVDRFLSYSCRNCRKSHKTYAFRLAWPAADKNSILAMKFGEIPSFGPPVPARLITLIGPDRDLFLRGRRSENLSLGIGAFAYYRRVVENQKSRLISQMGQVAARLGAGAKEVARFEAAAKETQFSRAIEEIKDAIPSVLLLDDHNPLTLLHSALSEGLHAQSEEECLEIATSIRLVMVELADRISQALKDEAELKTAVSRLLNRGQARSADGTKK